MIWSWPSCVNTMRRMYVFCYCVEQVFGIVRMGRFAGVQSQMGVRRGHQVNSGVLMKGKEFVGIFIFWFFY